MINIVTLLGRLTAAPELRTTSTGVSFASFTIAVERKFKKDEENACDFIDCVAWRTTADFICKYFNKGDPIAVAGSIQTHTYTDKNDNKRKAVEVVVDNVSFCGGKKTTQEASIESEAPAANTNDEADDLPF